MRGKLIVIEGTNNSGKETQTKLLVEKLNKDGVYESNWSVLRERSVLGKI